MQFPDTPHAFRTMPTVSRRRARQIPGFGLQGVERYVTKYGPKLQEYYRRLTGKEEEAPEAAPVAEDAGPTVPEAAAAGLGTGTLLIGGLVLLFLLSR